MAKFSNKSIFYSSFFLKSVKMSNTDPLPAKRNRKSLRLAATEPQSTSAVEAQRRHGMSTRSRAKAEGIVITDESLQIPRKRINRFRTLLHLNDDCLLAIFGHMNPYTLSIVGAACSRLNDLARYHFRIKHSCFSTVSLVETGTLNLSMMAKILRGFGDLITSLHLSCGLFGQSNKMSYDLLKLVKRNCPNLNTLTLEEFEVPQERVDKLTTLFRPIENLVLDNCTLVSTNLGSMHNLKTLKVQSCGTQFWLYIGSFPKLEQMEFVDMDTVEDNLLIRFVSQSPALKRLSVVNCEFVSTSVFEAISQLKQLEEFQFHQYYRRRPDQLFYADLMRLAAINSLKVLKLNCTKMSVARLIEAFVKNKIPIEHMVSGWIRKNRNEIYVFYNIFLFIRKPFDFMFSCTFVFRNLPMDRLMK